jgi:hypothetical protein
MKRFALLAAIALVVPGCDANDSLVPGPIDPAGAPLVSQSPGGPGCYGIGFDLLFRGMVVDPALPPVFEGELVAGDLEGTVDIVLTGATAPTGQTNTATFVFTWHITNGVVPELVGESFVTEIRNRNLNAVPPTKTPLGMAVGTHRVMSGVHRANLTYIGQAQVASLEPFVFENLLRHNGVICP